MQTSEEVERSHKIDSLPSEIWVHIVEFLEWNEMCRASTCISAKLTRSLLYDDHQELFFRHLCFVSMKKDIVKLIDKILGREIIFPYWWSTSARIKRKTNASPMGSSMKQLRNRLEYQSKMLYNYFPTLYTELSSLITQALNYSNSACIAVTQDDERELRNDHMRKPQVKTGYSFNFKKSDKLPKWKSIWNGYFKDSTKHKVLDIIQAIVFYPRRYRNGHLEENGFSVLKMSLKHLSPQCRYAILFKPNYSQSKRNARFKVCSSDIVGLLIYNMRRRRLSTNFDAFFPLLDYLVAESNIFYGNYGSLVKDIIPNTSALHYLLRLNGCVEHLKTFLTKYAFAIRSQTHTYRLSLLVHCLKYSVDLQIINHMICLDIINVGVLKHGKLLFKKKNGSKVSIAYHIVVCAFKRCGYSHERYNYLIQFTNLIIGVCNLESPNKYFVPVVESNVVHNQVPENKTQRVYEGSVPSDTYIEPPLLKLRGFKSVPIFKNLVQETYTEIPFPSKYSTKSMSEESELHKKFFGQFYKYCMHDSSTEETPLDEVVGFDRYSFGKFYNARRRK